ncbi:MAG: arabinogalactan endo-1,4-beta-galactosidase [Tannerellaceae bacterium]|nr:arabinogalactan endo-1,4-beta-galactosidase [Tannerellaceae bacterium]
MKFTINILFTILSLCTFIACSSNDEEPVVPEEPGDEIVTGFAKGADVSWVTEMEKAGYKFYNRSGDEKECIALMRELGMNAIRLRVWVNPASGWCNSGDLLIKAWRAKNLGMRIMVDFHYSDTWADPSSQTKPAAWANLPFNELKEAVATHTSEVLTRLKENDIDVEWIQIGNETRNGMLWDDGMASENMRNYAELNNAGYDVAKSIYPGAGIIVHIDSGDNNDLFRWIFDGLQSEGGKWDIIGMSLYPTADTWQQMNQACLANMEDMVARYNCPVILCEVGMPWDEAEICKAFLNDLIAKSQNIPQDNCLGIFYWEPQAYNNWNNYSLGAFDNSGMPTIALDAFSN